MIVEGIVLLIAGAIALGAPTIAKVNYVKGTLKRLKRKHTFRTEEGEFTIHIDEFVDEDGNKLVDFSVEIGTNDQYYVITEAEGKILSRQAVLEALIESGIFDTLSKKGKKKVLQHLFDAIDERNAEIRRSPGRFARKAA